MAVRIYLLYTSVHNSPLSTKQRGYNCIITEEASGFRYVVHQGCLFGICCLFCLTELRCTASHCMVAPLFIALARRERSFRGDEPNRGMIPLLKRPISTEEDAGNQINSVVIWNLLEHIVLYYLFIVPYSFFGLMHCSNKALSMHILYSAFSLLGHRRTFSVLTIFA